MAQIREDQKKQMQEKSLFKNSIYKSMLSFANIVIPLIIGPYITRLLNVELYGAYNKVFAEFQVFLIFAAPGIYTFGVREISKIRNDIKKVGQLFTNLFIISLITNIVVGVIYTVYALKTSSGITTYIYLVFLIQIVANIFYMEFLNEALENYKFITVKTIIVKVIYLVLILTCVRKPDDIIIYALVISFIQFLNNVLSYIYIKRRIKFDFSNVKLLQYIKPLFLVLVLSNVEILYGQLDRLMLGKYVSDVSVTFYFIPYNLIATLASIPYSVINVAIPRLSYLARANEPGAFEETLKKVIASVLFMILPMCFGVAVLAKEVVFLYAGDKYSGMVPVMIVACMMRIVISLQSVMSNLVLYVNDKEKVIVWQTFIFGVVNLILNCILTATGKLTPFTAMLSTTIATAGLVVVHLLYARRKMGMKVPIFTRQNMVYLILSLCFIPIAWTIKKIGFGFYANIALIIIACVLLYVGVLWIKKDASLNTIIGKIKNRLH